MGTEVEVTDKIPKKKNNKKTTKKQQQTGMSVGNGQGAVAPLGLS